MAHLSRARERNIDCIEIFYNRRRRHSQIAYLTPNQQELNFQQQQKLPDPHTSAGNQTTGQVNVSTKLGANPRAGSRLFCL
jgi:hypothetical protein